MNTELITDPAGLVPLEDEWRALAERRGNAFITPEWFRAWWTQSPQSISPLVGSIRNGAELIGVMPLVFDTQRRPRAIRFAGATWGDRFGPAAAAGDEDEVAAATLAAIHECKLDRHMLDLDHVDVDAGWWRAMQDAAAKKLVRIEQQRFSAYWIDLEGLDWDAYLASRSRNFRQQLRQRERRLREDHDMRIRTATDETLELDLAHFFSLHERRWQSRGDSALRTTGVVAFLRDFCIAAQNNGWLRLRLLEADGAPVAAFLGWRLGGVYAFYQSGFDPSWAPMSVGTVLMADTVRSAIEEGATEFDMLLGDEAYKRRFAPESREVQTVVLVGATQPARALASGEAWARRHGAWLRERRALGGLTRSLRHLLPTVDRF